MTNPKDPENPQEVSETEEPEPPVGHFKITYLGPVAPHWRFESEFGDRALLTEFQARTEARLLLLSPHDERQFKRNRERISRDAERSRLRLEWDLGYDEEEDGEENEA